MEHSPERQRQFVQSTIELTAAPIAHPEVQKRLILAAFPDAETPILPWLADDAGGSSLAQRFRDYVESEEHAGETIDLTSDEEVARLLTEVRKGTLH